MQTVSFATSRRCDAVTVQYAKSLLDRGFPYSAASRSSGVTVETLKALFPQVRQ